MSTQLVTGNHAAGHSMGLAGAANRTARGSVCGIYPITPQTAVVQTDPQYGTPVVGHWYSGFKTLRIRTGRRLAAPFKRR